MFNELLTGVYFQRLHNKMFLPIRSLSFTKAENIWRRPLGCEVLWGMKRLSCSLYFFCLPKIILLVCVLLPLEQTCDRKCRNCANNYTELIFVCAGVFWELMPRHEIMRDFKCFLLG